MRAILQLKTITELKKMIRETNIRGYSKLNKKQIIDKMMKEDKRFMDYVLKSHKQQQKETAKKEVKKTPVKKLKPKETHKMADGSVMSGAVHSKDSKPVKKKIKLTVTKADGTVKELKMKEKKPSTKELTDKARKDRTEQLNYLRLLEKRIKENNFDSYNRRTLSRLIMFLKKKSKYITDEYTDKQIKKFLDVAEKIKEDREKPKEKKPTAKELTDKAVEKAKARGAKVVRAEPKEEKVKKFKPIGKYEEIVKEKPRQNLYISSKKDDDDFARLFASLK
jgi:hypothetical protein